MCSDGAEQDGVSVCGIPGNHIHANVATSASLVFNDDRLAHLSSDALPEDAGHDIRGRARAEWHNELDGAGGVILRDGLMREAPNGGGGQECSTREHGKSFGFNYLKAGYWPVQTYPTGYVK
ncbi:hypothetical protein D3C71_1414370 [compost metagenome]